MEALDADGWLEKIGASFEHAGNRSEYAEIVCGRESTRHTAFAGLEMSA